MTGIIYLGPPNPQRLLYDNLANPALARLTDGIVSLWRDLQAVEEARRRMFWTLANEEMTRERRQGIW